MSNKGWVKFHRQIRENLFLMNDDNAYLVFTKLLIFVNSNGEYASGRNMLGELLHINPRTLYDVLIRLESQQMISISSNKRYSVISICNWEHYQRTPNNKLVTSPTVTQPQPNNDPTMTQHLNKNKEGRIKKKKPPSKIDQELAAKEKAAMNRKPGNGYQTALSISEALKLRKLGPSK